MDDTNRIIKECNRGVCEELPNGSLILCTQYPDCRIKLKIWDDRCQKYFYKEELKQDEQFVGSVINSRVQYYYCPSCGQRLLKEEIAFSGGSQDG